MRKTRRPTGSVQEIEGGWLVQVSYYVDGKQHRFSERVHGTIRDAERAKVRLFAKVDNIGKSEGIAVNPSMTFEAYLQTKWIPFLYRRQGSENRSPKSVTTVVTHFRLHVLPYPIAQVPCREMNCLRMDEWMAQLRHARPDLADVTLKGIITAVKTACRQAVAYDLMDKDPTLGMADKPHPRAYQAHDITKDEANTLMQAFLVHPLGLPFALVLACGMRPGEICGLRWRDFDFEAATVTPRVNVTQREGGGLTECRTKTEGSAAKLSIPRALMPLVASYRLARMNQNLAWGNPEALIFSQADGGLQWPSALSEEFQTLRQSLGLPYFRLYDQRAAGGTLAHNAGVSIFTISKMLRHTDIKTTVKFYAKDSTELRRDAAEIIGGIILPPRQAEG